MSARRPHLVSVIMPVYNAAVTLGDQLSALARQDYDGAWELLVVDNRSTDESTRVALRHSASIPSFRLCHEDEVKGAAAARNRGVAECRGDLLAFCDADDVASPGWLRTLVDAAVDADLVAGRELRVYRDSEGNLRPRPGQQSHPGRRPRHLGFLPFAVGGNTAVWKDVAEAVGGWRTDFLRAQDAEFSWRVQTAGYRFAYAPGAVMYYRDRESVRAAMRQHYGWGMQDARMVALYRSAGCRQTPWVIVAKRLLWLTTHLPDVAASRWRRAAYLKTAAGCAGRLRGSFRHRVRVF